MKRAIISLAAAAVVTTATTALSKSAYEIQQDFGRCLTYERHLSAHQCQMKYDPVYRSRMEEKVRREAEARRRAEEQRRRAAADARRAADRREAERRSRAAAEWARYMERTGDPCRRGGC